LLIFLRRNVFSTSRHLYRECVVMIHLLLMYMNRFICQTNGDCLKLWRKLLTFENVMFEVLLVSDICIICRSEILSVMVVISFEISFCYDKTIRGFTQSARGYDLLIFCVICHRQYLWLNYFTFCHFISLLYWSPEILNRILSRGLVDSEYNWPYYHDLLNFIMVTFLTWESPSFNNTIQSNLWTKVIQGLDWAWLL
jgi:hypothetical protein